MKGFSKAWCKWVEAFTQNGHVRIKINDQVEENFVTKKGLQGDPLSPILFNVVADMLAVLIKRAKQNGQIQGVVSHLVDDGLSILQYADDTIIFMEDDLETFEQLSGLKINFHKSEFFLFWRGTEFKEFIFTLIRVSGRKIPI
jgi:hypothetical protein